MLEEQTEIILPPIAVLLLSHYRLNINVCDHLPFSYTSLSCCIGKEESFSKGQQHGAGCGNSVFSALAAAVTPTDKQIFVLLRGDPGETR